MKHTARWIVPVLVGLLPLGLFAAEPPDDPPGKVKGEVVAVRQSTQTENQGAMTEIRVRTRNQEQLWLQLGSDDEFGEQVQVGDRIRARIHGRVGQDGEVLAVSEMYNDRTRARIRVRDQGGDLVPVRQQTRMQASRGDGTCDGTQVRERERIRDHSGGGGQGGRRGGGGGR